MIMPPVAGVVQMLCSFLFSTSFFLCAYPFDSFGDVRMLFFCLLTYLSNWSSEDTLMSKPFWFFRGRSLSRNVFFSSSFFFVCGGRENKRTFRLRWLRASNSTSLSFNHKNEAWEVNVDLFIANGNKSLALGDVAIDMLMGSHGTQWIWRFRLSFILLK